MNKLYKGTERDGVKGVISTENDRVDVRGIWMV